MTTKSEKKYFYITVYVQLILKIKKICIHLYHLCHSKNLTPLF